MPGQKPILLSTAYLPNIQYVSKLLSGNPVYIEKYETYPKQSFRNRAVIYGANGPLDLVIPVKRPSGNRTKTIDVELDYDMPWMQVHWKAIVSAYKHSPFFDIFEQELAPVYKIDCKYLVEWNEMLLKTMFILLGEEVCFSYTKSYIPEDTPDYHDLRNRIHPKKRLQQPDPHYTPPSYHQVFAEKHGFQFNLSFVDLLFNEGPDALSVCRRTIKKGNM